MNYLIIIKHHGGKKTVREMDLAHIAGYLFILGLVMAVIAGAAVSAYGANTQAWISVAFVVLGIVIGAFMATSKKIEEEIYVIVVITLGLLVASNMNVFQPFNTAASNLGTVINTIVVYIAMFSAAALVVLAIRTLTHFHVSKIRRVPKVRK